MSRAFPSRARFTPLPPLHLLDIRNRAYVEAALEAAGELDGVVSTPGINVRKRVLDYTDAELDRVIDVNLKGNFHVLQAAGRILAARRKGSIVLFSSIRSLPSSPGDRSTRRRRRESSRWFEAWRRSWVLPRSG